jgi:hypothetical protein
MLAIIAAFDPAVWYGLGAAILAITADAVITWLLKWKEGEFDIRLMPKFLQVNLFPYIAALIFVALLTLFNPTVYTPVFIFVSVIVTGKFSVEALKDKLVQFFKPANEPPSDSAV